MGIYCIHTAAVCVFGVRLFSPAIVFLPYLPCSYLDVLATGTVPPNDVIFIFIGGNDVFDVAEDPVAFAELITTFASVLVSGMCDRDAGSGFISWLVGWLAGMLIG